MSEGNPRNFLQQSQCSCGTLWALGCISAFCQLLLILVLAPVPHSRATNPILGLLLARSGATRTPPLPGARLILGSGSAGQDLRESAESSIPGSIQQPAPAPAALPASPPAARFVLRRASISPTEGREAFSLIREMWLGVFSFPTNAPR